ncbi:hypothetical protein CH305_14930 [Rhodococcus sp. 15-649-2-2]|uniref:hypothetical protein n=1 Tax=Rhodococcus sp. 15-649-2-2 TaxID=2023140 RepID=UPI000B9B81D4|nr:hypothetical protein [Rhodococcus sp. 15-649-2-2]OZE79800.1 hypothetical protein CH305_14930 [Rhodococcus sp. 15-649-2-2]
MPVAELAIGPETTHGLWVEKSALCNAILLDLFTSDAAQTFASMRRRDREGSQQPRRLLPAGPTVHRTLS